MKKSLQIKSTFFLSTVKSTQKFVMLNFICLLKNVNGGEQKKIKLYIKLCGVTFTMLNNVKANLKYTLKI